MNRVYVGLPLSGKTRPIQVFTFWGFVQRELLRFWRLALPSLAGARQPTFLNAESAHYLMTVLVDEARDAGRLRVEGRDYMVQDGDVIHFKFAT